MLMCHIDVEQFRGFVFRNETNKDIAIIVNSEVIPKKEFILRPMEVYYAYVGDLISVVDLELAQKSYIPYLYLEGRKSNKEKNFGVVTK